MPGHIWRSQTERVPLGYLALDLDGATPVPTSIVTLRRYIHITVHGACFSSIPFNDNPLKAFRVRRRSEERRRRTF